MKAEQTNAVKTKKARHYEQRRAIQANLIAPSTVVDPSHQNKKVIQSKVKNRKGKFLIKVGNSILKSAKLSIKITCRYDRNPNLILFKVSEIAMHA